LRSSAREETTLNVEPGAYCPKVATLSPLVPAEFAADAAAVVRVFESQLNGELDPPLSDAELAAAADAAYDPNV